MTSSHRPVKSLGQNFLVDERVQTKIINSCRLSSEDTVIEIGPGKGAMTALLLPEVKKLIAVEKDRQLVDILMSSFPHALSGNPEYDSGPPIKTFGGDSSVPQLVLVHADFLKWDMSALPDDLVIVGNIPYYISTPIIEKILENKKKIRRAFLTVQLEFGERLAASPGNGDYGSLTCFVQYYADVKVLFKISPGSFHPQPKVHSCFVSLTIKPKPEVAAKDEEKLFAMIQKAFMQRRKTITNALKGVVDMEALLKELERLKISPQSRPENLTLLNYIELCNVLEVKVV